MRSVLAVILLGLWLSVPGQGQDRKGVLIQGLIRDSLTATPIPGAFVTRRGEHRGILSDSLGQFALEIPSEDSLVLHVSQLGYRDAEVVVTNVPQDAFLVLLSPDPIKLEGLNVLSERFIERTRSVVGRGDLLMQPGLSRGGDGTGLDLLMRVVPLARPCRTGICAGTGARPLTVCVDEHRVRLIDVELEALDPRGLYAVEVFAMARQVRMYTRGYVERLLESGTRLPPVSFGCGG